MSKVAKGTKHTSEYLIWDPTSKDGGTLLAYCKGCRGSGVLFPHALLDGITRVPPGERVTVARLLRDSVECPMPGPSHSRVEIEWRSES